MDRVIVAAFVATFIAAVAAVVGVPVFAQPAPAQTVPTDASPMATPAESGGADAQRNGARARFMAMDTDHDGKISQAEWLAAGRHERGFAMMDADHDGFLTTDELRAGMAKMRAMREAKGAQ